MGDDEGKRIILARRARFVAAAMAGMNAAMCGGETTGDPRPCLSITQGDGGSPQVCLSPPLQPFDGGRADAHAADDAADDARPSRASGRSPPTPATEADRATEGQRHRRRGHRTLPAEV